MLRALYWVTGGLAALSVVLAFVAVNAAQKVPDVSPLEAAACIAFRTGSTWLGGDPEETCYRDEEAARDAETRRNFVFGFTILAGIVTLVVRAEQSTGADSTTSRPDEPGPGTTDTASERLQRLHDLHEEGVISDEEYNVQRQRVLDEL